MGYDWFYGAIGFVEEFRADLQRFYEQQVEIVANPRASQAEREGSIPSTRSSLHHKGLRWFSGLTEIDSFTESFTPSVPHLFCIGEADE